MLDKVVELAAHLQKETGKKVLWGTAQLFKHPRFAHGGATSEPLVLLRCKAGMSFSSSWEIALPGRSVSQASASGKVPRLFRAGSLL